MHLFTDICIHVYVCKAQTSFDTTRIDECLISATFPFFLSFLPFFLFLKEKNKSPQVHVLIYFIYFTEQISSSSSFIFDIKIEMWTIYNKPSKFIQKRFVRLLEKEKKKIENESSFKMTIEMLHIFLWHEY